MNRNTLTKVLIVGLGSIGQRHLRIARSLLPNADIRVLRHKRCDSTPDYANGCMSSIAEALAFAPEAAVIANPSVFHMETALPLAGIGVHLLVEKPLAASINDVPQLIATCAAQGTVLMTAYNLRFQSSLQEYRNLICEKFIGNVLSVRCEVGQYLPSWRPSSDYRKGVSALRAMGGGALLELSHEIDYLRWIFGEIKWVKAELSKQSNLDIDVEDTAHLILGFKDNSDGNHLIARLDMDFVRHDKLRQCYAIGELGTLRWNGLTGVIDKYSSGENEWTQVFSRSSQSDESYISEWEHFLDCVRYGTNPLISGRDGLAVLNIIEAARLSAAGCNKTPVFDGN